MSRSFQVSAVDANVNCLLLNNLDGVDRIKFMGDWTRARVKICADGAFKLLKELALDLNIENVESIYPDFIVGDMDSLSHEDLAGYEKSGKGKVIRMKSQDMTDFEKCAIVYSEQVTISTDEWLLVYGALGGDRLDHTMAAFHPLVKFNDLKMKIVYGPAFAFILPAGENKLLIDVDIMEKKCGLFPIVGPTRTTSDGLAWNLDNSQLEYGKMISCSNQIASKQVTIACDHQLLFTFQV